MPKRDADAMVRLELPREFVADLLEALAMTRAVMRRLARPPEPPEGGSPEGGSPEDGPPGVGGKMRAAAAASSRRAGAMMRLIERQIARRRR